MKQTNMSCLQLQLISITFYFRRLREKLPPKILLCLCVSLTATLLIFLIGVSRTESRVQCQATAILLHYFLLSTTFWMTVEGLNLYLCFVKVMDRGRSSRIFMLRSSFFAWGELLTLECQVYFYTDGGII